MQRHAQTAGRHVPPQPRLRTVLAAALLVGLLWGALFGVRESARVLIAHRSAAKTMAYGEILRFGLRAGLTYALLGLAFMAVIGPCLGLAAVARRLDLGRHRILTVAAASIAFFTFAVLFLLPHEAAAGHKLRAAYALAEAGAMALLGAAGVAAAVGAARQRLSPGRLAALGVALLLGLFVLGNWSVWLYLAALPGHGPLVVRLGEAAMVLVPLLLGVGLFALADPVGAGRRRVAGAALLVGAGVVFAAAHLGLSPQADGSDAAAPRAASGGERPNILWIVMDTARADALSCYGASRQTTPAIDSLASDGVLYERAIAAAPWTLPSHASMFTGLLPSRHGCTAEHQYLEDDFTTIAEVLTAEGYRTFGYSNNSVVGPDTNLHQGFQQFEVHHLGRTWQRELVASRFGARLHRSDYGAAATNACVRRWIADVASGSQPFFVFINYMEPHRFYGVTPEYRRWVPEQAPIPRSVRSVRRMLAHMAGGKKLTEDELALMRALYDSDVHYLDARIGELLRWLERRGLLDSTVVILTSDHGEHFGEHGFLLHTFSLYNELLHVPLIIRYPRRFRRGAREPNVVHGLDIFATILDVAGIRSDPQAHFAGRSLLAPAATDPQRAVISESAFPVHTARDLVDHYPPARVTPYLRRLRSIQTARYKYLWASDGEEALYDLRRDPGEEHDIRREQPERARALKAQLASAGEEPAVPPEARRPVASPEETD